METLNWKIELKQRMIKYFRNQPENSFLIWINGQVVHISPQILGSLCGNSNPFWVENLMRCPWIFVARMWFGKLCLEVSVEDSIEERETLLRVYKRRVTNKISREATFRINLCTTTKFKPTHKIFCLKRRAKRENSF